MKSFKCFVAAALSVAGMLAAAPQAPAATSASSDGVTLTIIGGPENNGIIIQHVEETGRFHVRDAAGLVPGPGCPLEHGVLRCDGGLGSTPAPTYVQVAGGDGDDYVEALASGHTLASGGGFISIDGGFGNDELSLSGAFRGRSVGGDGDDILRAGDSSFSDLIGDAGNDVLEGGYGADDMNGGPGDDELRGQEGRDVFVGGSGADYLRTRDLTKDKRISCGGGRDRVVADPFDPRRQGCERRGR